MRLLILLITLVLSCPVMAQGTCSTEHQPSCVTTADGYKRVFERLADPSGTHNTYELSAAPAGQFPVHIFKDGIELSSGSDYKLEGQQVRLYGNDVTSKGGTYQAAYFLPTTISRRVAKSVNEVAPDSTTKRVLGTFLSRSLQTELTRQGGTDGEKSPLSPLDESGLAFRDQLRSVENSEPAMTRRAERDSTRDDEPEPQSIRMLESILASRSMRARSSRHRKTSESQSAQGLEGVGDALVASPFDRVVFRSTRGAGMAIGSSHETRVPASLRMLKQITQGQ